MAQPVSLPTVDEDSLIAGVRKKDESAIRGVIQKYNRRLFRIARSVMRDDSDAEDVLQEAYIRALQKIGQFRKESSLGTWLSRIVLNEALDRLRKQRPSGTPLSIEAIESGAQIIPFPLISNQPDPEQSMAQNQIRNILEHAIDDLPEDFRIVLVARTIEEMSIEETAELLDLKPETVKTRLHRARLLLTEKLEEEIGPTLMSAFPFAGRRCQNMADRVIERLMTEI